MRTLASTAVVLAFLLGSDGGSVDTAAQTRAPEALTLGGPNLLSGVPQRPHADGQPVARRIRRHVGRARRGDHAAIGKDESASCGRT